MSIFDAIFESDINIFISINEIKFFLKCNYNKKKIINIHINLTLTLEIIF